MNETPSFLDLSPFEVRERFAQLGLPDYRAAQALRWVYARHTLDYAAMTNLPTGTPVKR